MNKDLHMATEDGIITILSNKCSENTESNYHNQVQVIASPLIA